jgi:sensor c-di-GMP phosphodiesterase-like protein
MGDKVALPSLNLPKQRTHWSVGVVIAGGVLLLILAGAFLAVIRSQQAKAEAFARREADRAEAIKAETERLKAETERASAEARKKQAEAAASNAAAAAAQSKPAVATNEVASPKRASTSSKKKGSRRGSVASGSARPALAAPGSPAAAPAAAPKPASSKASKDIDDILKGFK